MLVRWLLKECKSKLEGTLKSNRGVIKISAASCGRVPEPTTKPCGPNHALLLFNFLAFQTPKMSEVHAVEHYVKLKEGNKRVIRPLLSLVFDLIFFTPS